MTKSLLKGLLLSLVLASQGVSQAKDRSFKKGQLIIQWKGGPSLNFADSGAKLKPLKSVTNSFSGVNQTYLVDFGDLSDSELFEKIKNYENDPNVAIVEPNFIVKLQEMVPNDEKFTELWGMQNTGQQGGEAGADLGATKAWMQTTGSRDVKVAVIDTGVDYNHPDLKNNIYENPGESGLDDNGEDKRTNGIDDDGNGYVDDWHGWDAVNGDNDPMDGHSHGTHCAGTIGAEGNNEIGVAGVNWQVSIIPIKIFRDGGSTTTAAIIAGISYANTIGADIQSNSWGGGNFSDGVYDVIREARDNGALFVAAAGNNYKNDNDARPFYPASYDLDNIVSVASMDRKNKISSFSNVGLTSVDVAAPGSSILSTVPDNGYGVKSGTSMATPHVAGVLALIKSKFKDADYKSLRTRLFTTSERIQVLEGQIAHGFVSAMDSLEVDEVAPSTVAGLTVERVGLLDTSLSYTPSGDDGDEGNVSYYEFRKSSEPIVTKEQWDQATILNAEAVSVTDTKEMVNIRGFTLSEEAFISVVAYDNVGNMSQPSDSVHVQLREKEIVYLNDGDNLEGFEISGTWGYKTIDGVSYLADSPDGNYENNSTSTLISPTLVATSEEVYLELVHTYSFERNYDMAYLEIKTESSEEWVELKSFTSYADVTDTIALYQYVEAGEAFKLRFRVKTDSSVVRKGWDIYKVTLFQAK